MKKIYIMYLLSCSLLSGAFGQSVLNPADTIATYNPASPPTQPAYGQIGKWIRTKRFTWNTSEYKCYIYKGIPFRLHFPKTYNPTANDGKKYPLLVFFHGLGEADTSLYDNEFQLYHGGENFSDSVDSGKYDGYVLYMQSQSFWGNNYYQAITELIDYMIPNNKLDPFAVSVNGLSAGGQATWEMMFSHLTYVAAAAPMSSVSISYTNQDTINKIKFTPVWDVQGGLDGSPAPYTAHQVRDAMLAKGANLTYTEFSTQGHDTWDSTWLLPQFYTYLNNAYSSNPWTLFGRNKFCPGDNINVTIGLAPGFQAYQWRRNGTLISGATTNTIQVTQPATYDARVQRNGIWSDWSRIPVQIVVQSPSQTPPIQVSGLMSTALPSADDSNSNYVNLQVSGSDTYTSYTWKKVGSDSVYSTKAIFTVAQTGYYTVAALPLYGCSALYSPAFKVIDANGPNAPNPVKSLIANAVSNTAIQLSWSNPPQQANKPTAFEIYRGKTNGVYSFIGQVAPSVSSFTDAGVAPRTKYFYVIRAIDSTGAAGLSNVAIVSTLSDITDPSIPGNLKVVYTTPTSISIAWSASTDNVAVDHYNIYINGSLSNVTKKTAFVLTGLLQSHAYAIYVKAVDASNNVSSKSNQVTSEPILGGLQYSYYAAATPWKILPDFPTLTPTTTGVSKNISISIATQPNNFGIMWQGYLQVPVTGTYTFQTTSDEGSALYFNSYTPTGKRLVNNDGVHFTQSKRGSVYITAGIYPVCIEYFQASGNKNMTLSWSNTTLFGDTAQHTISNTYFNGTYVSPGPPPGIPTNVAATATAFNKINLTWKDNSTNESCFEIYRSTSPAGTYTLIASAVANATAYIDSLSLSSSTIYYYRIQSINVYGNSGLTDSVKATTFATPAAPATPANFKATAASASAISLTWSTVTNASGYQLLRSIADTNNYNLLTTLAASAKAYSDTGLNANLKHYYKIKTTTAAGILSAASAASATTKNTAPVITKLSSVLVGYGSSKTIAVDASDSDGDALSYTSRNLPAFASISANGSTGVNLILNPSSSNIGTYNKLTIIAADAYGGKDSTVFNLTVNNNFAPTIDTITDYTLNENDTLSIYLNAKDQNSGDNLNWSAANLPDSYVLTNLGNGKAKLFLQPGYLAAGSYSPVITVNDGNGGITTRQFNLIVNDVNPNTTLYVRFKYVDTIGKPWNSITATTTNNLKDASGKTTNIGLALQTSWFATYNNGPSTGNNSGVYPDAVLKDYYYFGIFGGPETVATKITGLNPSRSYNLTFLGASLFPGAVDNGSTIYTAGGQSDTLEVQGNTTNTVTLNNITPASDGTITYTMSKDTDAQAGYINSLVISSIYNDGIAPVAPATLTAQAAASGSVQLLWNDVAYNETGYNIYRALTPNNVYTLIGQTQAEAASFTDTTATGNTRYSYKIAAFNANGTSAFSNVATITTGDNIPQLNPIADVILKNNQSYIVNITAKDDSADDIALSVSGLPAFATFTDNGNGTGTINITPTANNLGAYAVIVTATDESDSSVSTSFNILVTDPNVSSTYLSFSDAAHSLPKPWNLIGPYPIAGTSFNNIKDDGNTSTGIKLTFKNGFQGIVESGMQPVDGLGIYPNVVMRTGEYESGTRKDTIQLSGLSASKMYNFVFFNSHDDGLNCTTNFTIGAKTVTLNATDNLSKTVQINGIVPDASGTLYIVVSKASGADYAFISTLIIQCYAPAYTGIAPTNLRTTKITRNSIGLMWEDRAPAETGYQIWRAIDTASSYTLLTTLSAGVTTYTDGNLTANKKYTYAVRAVIGSAFSNFSNSVSASTYAYNVYLNYTASNNASLPWNNLDAVPQNGYTWSNFFDEKGVLTGTGMELNTDWAGLYSAGVDTATSGIYPTAVMIDSYGLFPGQTAVLQVTGLNLKMKYDFTFFASSQAYGDVNVAYTINGVTTLLNASLNVNATQTIYGITPDAYGNVTISVAAGTRTSQFGLLGALVIGGYTPSASAVTPKLPSGGSKPAVANQTATDKALQKNIAVSNQLSVFPNPFHDYFTITMFSQTDNSKMQIIMYDATGKAVYTSQWSGIHKGINSFRVVTNSAMAAGIYSAVILNADTKEATTIRLLKQ